MSGIYLGTQMKRKALAATKYNKNRTGAFSWRDWNCWKGRSQKAFHLCFAKEKIRPCQREKCGVLFKNLALKK
ncbi:Uncharacterised protein [Serratia quinivorans]|nr:Uncharacterised protein [Serratia quinivorans]